MATILELAEKTLRGKQPLPPVGRWWDFSSGITDGPPSFRIVRVAL
jgi:hypothetical protein